MSPEAFQPGEEELPEGWDPSSDNDPMFQAVVQLLRESDRPQMPPPAMFEAVRLQTRRQLLEEGLISAGPKHDATDTGFVAWIQNVLFGGRLGGQLVRLGTVGVIAFVAGTQFYMAPSSGSQTVADAPKPGVVAPVPTDKGVAVLPTPTPAPPLHDTELVKGMGGEWTAPSWKATASLREPSQGMVAVSNPYPALGPQHGPSSQTNRDLANRAMEQIQLLKVGSMLDRDHQQVEDIRRLEETLSELVRESHFDQGMVAMAFDKYRVAEGAAAAGKYAQAQQTFDEIVSLAPGSSLAFVAQFQIGLIAREYTGDYELALESFRECLDKYPSQAISPRREQYLREQVEILTQEETENWSSLRSFQKANTATTVSGKVDSLLDVVRDSASGRLATEAAERLRELVLSDVGRNRLDWALITTALRDRVEGNPPGPDTARIQFCLAEISIAERNFEKAAEDYQRALLLEPDAKTLREIRSRMSLIGNRDIPRETNPMP